jgi:hypothetical protein
MFPLETAVALPKVCHCGELSDGVYSTWQTVPGAA